MNSTVRVNIKLRKISSNVLLLQSVMFQHSLRVSEVLKTSSTLLQEMKLNLKKMQAELLETDLVLQLKATSRDGERSGKTEKTPSNLFQRLLVAMLIVLKDAQELPTMLHTMVLHTDTTQVSTNAVSNANASIQLLRLTGEASITRLSPKTNTENPSPNSLRKNVLNWPTLFKLMKNHMDQFEHFAF